VNDGRSVAVNVSVGAGWRDGGRSGRLGVRDGVTVADGIIGTLAASGTSSAGLRQIGKMEPAHRSINKMIAPSAKTRDSCCPWVRVHSRTGARAGAVSLFGGGLLNRLGG